MTKKSRAISKLEYTLLSLVIISILVSGVAIFFTMNISTKVEELMRATVVSPVTATTPTPEVIKIGVEVPLTGPNAYNGWLMARGALVAQKFINERGGVLGKKLVVVIEDETPTAEGAILAAEKLVTVDKVVAIVGFYKSFTSKAVIESVISKYHVPMFTAGWSNALTEMRNKYVFRAGPLIAGQIDQWVAFIEELAEKTGRKKFAAYSENTDYGTEFQSAVIEGLKKHGKVEIVADFYHDYLATDFTSDLIKIKEAGAEIFWTATVSANVMTMIKQAEAVGLKKQAILLAVADGFYFTEEYINTVGKSGDLLITNAFHLPGTSYTEWTPIMDSIYKELGYGDHIEYYITLQVCQDVLLVAQAIEKAKSTNSDAIVEALEKHEFLSPWGKVKFRMDPTGPYYHQWVPPMLFVQFQDLKLKIVYPPELATSSLKY